LKIPKNDKAKENIGIIKKKRATRGFVLFQKAIKVVQNLPRWYKAYQGSTHAVQSDLSGTMRQRVIVIFWCYLSECSWQFSWQL
jgi:hypothetical protein